MEENDGSRPYRGFSEKCQVRGRSAKDECVGSAPEKGMGHWAYCLCHCGGSEG